MKEDEKAAATAVQPQDSKAEKKDTKSDDTPSMHIRVASPFTVYFNEEALSISAENDTGPFDILPHHHNFITLLGECEIVVRKRVGESRIQISGGVMHVKADQVIVFLNV